MMTINTNEGTTPMSPSNTTMIGVTTMSPSTQYPSHATSASFFGAVKRKVDVRSEVAEHLPSGEMKMRRPPRGRVRTYADVERPLPTTISVVLKNTAPAPLSPEIEAQITATLEQYHENILERGRKHMPTNEVFQEIKAMLETALRYAARGLRVIAAERYHPEAGTYSNLWRYKRDKAAGIIEPGEVDSSASKRPLGCRWQERASLDFDAVRETFESLYWRSKKRGAEGYIPITYPVNLSIVTGEQSGYFVLDVDGETGRANLKDMEAERGAMPVTLKSISGSGSGDHYIFRLPPDTRLYNTAGAFGGEGSKLDIRGENGQIIAAPSVHQSGGVYR